MPKKVSDSQKKEMIESFFAGKTINQLSEEFNCSKTTITRHLKKNIEQETYKNFVKTNQQAKEIKVNNIGEIKNENESSEYPLEEQKKDENKTSYSSFVEIAPLNYEIDEAVQKDLSSVPITDIDFPKTVFMVVDKKIELEIKYLKDYPEWQFLSQEELNRKTIQIYDDLKIAKRFCNKEQKVIKVPNTHVFKIVAPILLSKGISRIINEEKLIAL